MFHEEREDLVSIIIPIYNVYNYIDRCLETIVNQTYTNIEIILINDGSTDNSALKCIEWQKKDDRIIFVSKKNEHQGPTRNLGIHMAHGKYIMFVDSDDYTEYSYVEKMYHAISKLDADMVVCDYYKIINGKKNPIVANWDIEGVTNFRENRKLLQGISGAPWAKIHRREFLIKNGIVQSEYNGQDSEMYVEELILAKRVGQVKEILYYYDIDREGNATTTGINQARGIAFIAKNVVEFFKKRGLYEDVKEDLRKFLTRVYLYAFYHDNSKFELRSCIDKKLYVDTINTMKSLFDNWDEKQLEKVLLIGNPSSRVCVSDINPFSSFFSEICLCRYNFSSIISMLNDAGEFDCTLVNLPNKYRQEMVLKDIQKKFRNEKFEEIKYVIIDFLEERYDIIKYNNHYYTKSREAEKVFERCKDKYKVLQRNSKEVEQLWYSACDELCYLLKQHFEEEQIYLIKGYASKNMRDYDCALSVKELNETLQKYYDYFEDKFKRIHVIV